ncbi:hypothetical protein V5T82_09885 [Magnetovibrio sp. PR-2]|uniref:hypothetical protein n=1 Tax=Magnetovibrio sp. PR-2 TaxID=3120356 RepID=UPI002FCE311F
MNARFLHGIWVGVFAFVLTLPQTLHAGDATPEGIYQLKKIKNRSSRGFTANGTVVYQYTRVDRRAKPEDAAKVGNINVGKRSHVRDVYNRTVIDRNLNLQNKSVSIGEVTINGANTLNSVDNRTQVSGDLSSSGGQINTGNIKTHGNARINTLRNSVTVQGNVNVR